ncbi:Ribose ABC transporter substrate-binding protein [Arthrobacter sp. 9V]|uniref:substrate-binding domain-containing protein n=1 Tax=Arthrobacter sp. 9V TaxID=2653132 RepID=UPI0012EFB950|nr:substrate-binding domain-containing protein [Arthrobacter sp. 9V]VXB66341.1 Ribose ABC transporter substrate-binding protein [Arthrobacter sp. 9V]
MSVRTLKWKAAIALTGVLLSSTALTACNRDTGAAAAGQSGGGERMIIGFSQGTMNHPWRVAMVDQNVAYAKENLSNVDVKVTDGQNSASTQASNIEALIAQHPKAIILSPLTADALTPVAKKAMDAGIPVITLDREVNTPVTTHIGADNKQIAEEAGKFMGEKLGGKGNIIEIQGTAGASATIDRNSGFADAISKFPGLKIVASTDGDYQRNNATKFIENNIQRFKSGEVTAVYAHNDEMALGARLALEQAGVADKVTIVSIDGQNEAIQAVADGKLAATFTYPYCAPEGIKAAYDAATGKTPDKKIVLKSVKIDAENAKEYIGKGF